MTCAELRARLVDPGSSGKGGHAPVVDHLEVCADCRGLARAFGGVERVFRPDPATEAPADMEQRVLDRILEESGAGMPAMVTDPGRRNLLIALVAIALLVLAGALTAIRRSGGQGSSTEPVTRALAPAAAPTATAGTSAGPGPDSLGGFGLTSAPVSDDEKNVVGPILPHDFLLSAETLASLDPFFPQDLASGPVEGIPVPERLPGEERDLTERVIEWRHLPPQEQLRILNAQQRHAAWTDPEKRALRQRWTFYQTLTSTEQSGLGRAAVRFRDLDARRGERLKTELRSMAKLPPDRRASAWRNSSFGKMVTGQESAAIERLWSVQP